MDGWWGSRHTEFKGATKLDFTGGVTRQATCKEEGGMVTTATTTLNLSQAVNLAQANS